MPLLPPVTLVPPMTSVPPITSVPECRTDQKFSLTLARLALAWTGHIGRPFIRFALVAFALSCADAVSAADDTVRQHTTAIPGQMFLPADAIRQSQPLAGRSNLGGPNAAALVPEAQHSAAATGIAWQAHSDCVAGELKRILAGVVAVFGPITVTSTCRDAPLNKAVGGAEHSFHLAGQAVDFRLTAPGSPEALYAHLSQLGSVGGLKHYGDGLFHIDTGPRRTW